MCFADFKILWEAKVNNFNLIQLICIFFKEYIFRFQISVHDLMLMAIVNTLQNRFHDKSGILLIEGISPKDLVKQFTSFTYFRNDLTYLIIFEIVINFKNIRMIYIN